LFAANPNSTAFSVEETMLLSHSFPQNPCPARPTFHPGVEILEDRCCPTSLRVGGGVVNLAGERALSATHLQAKHRHHHPRRGHRPAPPIPASVARRILVNGVPSPVAVIHTLQHLGLRPLPGSYWYDPRSGAAGLIGQGTSGFLPPGLPLGGPLQADASNGTSGVFVNGRQLTTGEEAFLEAVLGSPIAPGRYFLDANGDAGMEGGPVLVNLIQLARQRGVGHTGALTTYDRTGISVLGSGSFIGILNQAGNSVTFA
jgi:hypothetical protein